MNKLAVIIVTYNSELVLKQCLPTLNNLLCDYDIFISDNGSTDNTIKIAKEYSCTTIKNNDNLGYSKAINKALEKINSNLYHYTLILNPDTYMNEAVDIKALTDDMPDKSLISIRMVSSKGKYRINTYKFPSLINIFLNRKRLLDLSQQERSIIDVETVEGSFMLIATDTIKNLDGFDSNIFLYGEDYEFCYRVTKNGGRVIYNGNYSYVHDGGFKKERRIYVNNGLKYFFKKHKTNTYFMANLILTIKGHLLRLK